MLSCRERQHAARVVKLSCEVKELKKGNHNHAPGKNDIVDREQNGRYHEKDARSPDGEEGTGSSVLSTLSTLTIEVASRTQ